ncbi:MAG: GNAT family N-acetyltransferase [Caldilineaceae bacterium]
MSLTLVAFHAELLSQAGALLAARHCRDRALCPALPARFEDPVVATDAVAAALQRSHALGFAALQEDRLVAYLIGDMQIDNLWGRTAWVRTAGCAYDPAVGVEPVRDLYAALGEQWVRYGVFFHFALIPVTDQALIHAWFSLSFGIEQIHALLDLQAWQPATPAAPAPVTIQRAAPADRHHLASLSDVIWRQQVQAPVWGVQMPEAVAENRAGWAELVDEADVTVWLAMQANEAVGVQGYWPAEPMADNLMIPAECVHMSVAGTRPSARRQGIGAMLTQHGLAQAKAQGYHTCETDWRSTNLLASRFWPKQGFQPAVYRLVRRIDQRIAWANGSLASPHAK